MPPGPWALHEVSSIVINIERSARVRIDTFLDATAKREAVVRQALPVSLSSSALPPLLPLPLPAFPTKFSRHMVDVECSPTGRINAFLKPRRQRSRRSHCCPLFFLFLFCVRLLSV